MVTMIVAALQALAALPKIGEQIRSLITGIVTLWTEREIAKMKAENIAAIREVIEKHDQRKLEEALGSPSAGKPSGDPGTSIVDSIPGLHKP